MHNLLQVGVNNVVLPTVNNVVNIEQGCVVPSEQCCQQEKQSYNNNEQACSINIAFPLFQQPLLLHQC